jgi:hypothetical protein
MENNEETLRCRKNSKYRVLGKQGEYKIIKER